MPNDVLPFSLYSDKSEYLHQVITLGVSSLLCLKAAQAFAFGLCRRVDSEYTFNITGGMHGAQS
jgi:hypothetical protein